MDFSNPPVISFIGVSILMIIAVIIDVRVRRIPNWLTVSAFALGVVFHTVAHGWSGLWFSMAGFAVGFAILYVLWLIGGGGGGDVKLMGAVGAWSGPLFTLLIFLGSAIFAVLCVMFMIVKNGPRKAREQVDHSQTNSRTAVKQYIPYAVPVAMAVWTVFLFQLIKAS